MNPGNESCSWHNVQARRTHDFKSLRINQFQRCPSPPGNRRAFAHVVSPGGGAFPILSQPGGWALAYPGATPGHLHTCLDEFMGKGKAFVKD